MPEMAGGMGGGMCFSIQERREVEGEGMAMLDALWERFWEEGRAKRRPP